MFQEGVVVVVVSTPQGGGQVEVDIIPKGVTIQLDSTAMSDIKAKFLASLDNRDITRDRLYSKDRISKEISRLFIEHIGKNPVVIPILVED
jgi:mRNA degradation ribonuclease J1/J2